MATNAPPARMIPSAPTTSAAERGRHRPTRSPGRTPAAARRSASASARAASSAYVSVPSGPATATAPGRSATIRSISAMGSMPSRRGYSRVSYVFNVEERQGARLVRLPTNRPVAGHRGREARVPGDVVQRPVPDPGGAGPADPDLCLGQPEGQPRAGHLRVGLLARPAAVRRGGALALRAARPAPAARRGRRSGPRRPPCPCRCGSPRGRRRPPSSSSARTARGRRCARG